MSVLYNRNLFIRIEIVVTTSSGTFSDGEGIKSVLMEQKYVIGLLRRYPMSRYAQLNDV